MTSRSASAWVGALSNTNESQTDKIKLGEEMDAPDLGTSLKKGLEGTLRYTKKDAKDNSESGYINLADLGDEAVEAYHELEKKIEDVKVEKNHSRTYELSETERSKLETAMFPTE